VTSSPREQKREKLHQIRENGSFVGKNSISEGKRRAFYQAKKKRQRSHRVTCTILRASARSMSMKENGEGNSHQPATNQPCKKKNCHSTMRSQPPSREKKQSCRETKKKSPQSIAPGRKGASRAHSERKIPSTYAPSPKTGNRGPVFILTEGREGGQVAKVPGRVLAFCSAQEGRGEKGGSHLGIRRKISDVRNVC